MDFMRVMTEVRVGLSVMCIVCDCNLSRRAEEKCAAAHLAITMVYNRYRKILLRSTAGSYCLMFTRMTDKVPRRRSYNEVGSI